MKSFVCSLLFLFAGISFSQTLLKPSHIQQDSLQIDRFIGTDNFGSLYTIDNDVLYKWKDGKNWQYTNLELGTITSVDILNPLKITVFYEDFNTVIILDNTLNEIKRINFNTIENFKNLSAATTANDRNLWIFDTNTQQLEIFNYITGKTTFQNQPITEKVIAVKSNYNFCYILTETHLYTFNIYGSMLSKKTIEQVLDFMTLDARVILLKQGKLYEFKENEEKLLQIPYDKISVKQFSLHNDILYIYDGVVLHQWQLAKPPSKKE